MDLAKQIMLYSDRFQTGALKPLDVLQCLPPPFHHCHCIRAGQKNRDVWMRLRSFIQFIENEMPNLGNQIAYLCGIESGGGGNKQVTREVASTQLSKQLQLYLHSLLVSLWQGGQGRLKMFMDHIETLGTMGSNAPDRAASCMC